MGNEQFSSGMWEYFTLQRAEAKKILEGATRERQEGTQGQWQQESLFREILEQVRRKCGCGMWRPNDAERLPCDEGRQLGRVQRKIQGRRRVIRMDSRKNARNLRKKWQKMKLDSWALCRKF